MHRGVLKLGLVTLCVGCSNVLGADFDQSGIETTLTVTKPQHPADDPGELPMTGSGTVTSDDGNIDCGPSCAATYSVPKTEVTLTAVPAPGSAFAGWHGTSCDNARSSSCTLELHENADAHLEAYFVQKGANVWNVPLANAETSSGVGIVAGPNGDTFAVGDFEGTLHLPGVDLANAGGHDVFVLHFDADGEMTASGLGETSGRTIASTLEDRARDLALSEAGPVVIGVATGKAGTSAKLNPLERFVAGPSDGFIAAFNEKLGLRWGFVTNDEGSQQFESVAVADDGSTYVLGTTTGQMVLGELVVESPDENVFLLRIDPGGTPTDLETIGGTTAIDLAVLHGSSDVLIGGREFDEQSMFQGCTKPSGESEGFIARVNMSERQCVDLVSFAGKFSVHQILTTNDNQVFLTGLLQSGTLDLDPSDPKAKATATELGSYLVIRLDSHLKWVPGESWIQNMDGYSKLQAAGVGAELVLSTLALGDVWVGPEKTLIPFQTQRGLTLLGFALTGELLWSRNFGNIDGAAVSQISWHDESETWFLSADAVSKDAALSLDLQNLTQPPTPFHGQAALFGRFAP